MAHVPGAVAIDSKKPGISPTTRATHHLDQVFGRDARESYAPASVNTSLASMTPFDHDGTAFIDTQTDDPRPGVEE